MSVITTSPLRPDFGETGYRAFTVRSNEARSPRPLSLYVHPPFCARLCFYGACSKVVTKNRARRAVSRKITQGNFPAERAVRPDARGRTVAPRRRHANLHQP